MKKRSPTERARRPAQPNVLMVRLYPQDRADLAMLMDHLTRSGGILGPVTRSIAVRWALRRAVLETRHDDTDTPRR